MQASGFRLIFQAICFVVLCSQAVMGFITFVIWKNKMKNTLKICIWKYTF